VSSKPSRRPFGLKLGYASSRAHNNKTSRSGLGFHLKLKHGFKCCTCRSYFYNSNGVLKGLAQAARIEGGLCEFARARQQITPVARLCIRVDFQYCVKCCTCRSCFHNSNGVFKTLAQAVWIEGGLCEFARAQMASSAAPVACVFITPTVSSKDSRRPLGLKVGYASLRAHDNK
jgi:hypothetical protein